MNNPVHPVIPSGLLKNKPNTGLRPEIRSSKFEILNKDMILKTKNKSVLIRADNFSKMHKNLQKFIKMLKNRAINSYFAGEFQNLFVKTKPITGHRREIRNSNS